tara:strand:- start:41 stop:628 length:588 start_codon:yes stop_codon:yes gene_type:complete
MTTSHQAESIDLGAANQAALMAHIVNEKLTPESLVDSSVAAGNKFKTSERLLAAYLNHVIEPAETKNGKTFWYDVAYRATGDLANRTQKEKKIIFGYYKAQDYANPSVPWSRIRVIAEELVTGEPKKAERAQVRDLHVRYCEELGKLYKAGNDPANDETIMNHPKSAAIRDALIDVTKGLKKLGVDLDTLTIDAD